MINELLDVKLFISLIFSIQHQRVQLEAHLQSSQGEETITFQLQKLRVI